MPPVSENQRKAMRAAASGNSTLGIPAKVGKEFSAADPGGKLPKRVRRGGGQFNLPKSNNLPPKKVNVVLDAQSDAAVGLPKSGGMKAMKLKG